MCSPASLGRSSSTPSVRLSSGTGEALFAIPLPSEPPAAAVFFPLVVRFERDGWRGLGPRFYTLSLELDAQLGLFDDGAPRGWLLVISRGALGTQRKSTPIVRRERFAQVHRAFERWGELASRRRQHGYKEVP